MADDKIKIPIKYKAVIFAAIPFVLLVLIYLCTAFIIGSAVPSNWEQDDRGAMIGAWAIFTVFGEVIAGLIFSEY